MCDLNVSPQCALPQVDSLMKNSLYMRQQNLEKIMYEYDKTRSLNKEKTDLQMQRKMSNMRAALQRQTVQAVSLSRIVALLWSMMTTWVGKHLLLYICS